jgi:hypothetical protein
MLALVSILVIAWIIVGIIGFAVHGLFWLFMVAWVLFVLTLLSRRVSLRSIDDSKHRSAVTV